jgi:protein phosphatase
MNKLTIAGITDVGTRRSSNQDTIDWRLSDDGQRALVVVADGMGGHAGGDVASELAVAAVMQLLGPRLSEIIDIARRQDLIQQAIDDASHRIVARQADEPALGNMGTTLVLAWVQAGNALIGHIGDSRCYLFSPHRQPELKRKTRDDTVVQNMVDDGSISEAEIPNIPFRNMLTRALGTSDDVTATLTQCDLAAGEQLLLCSDGLTDAIPEAHWPGLLNQPNTPAERARALIDTSLDNQAADNVSVVLIERR